MNNYFLLGLILGFAIGAIIEATFREIFMYLSERKEKRIAGKRSYE